MSGLQWFEHKLKFEYNGQMVEASIFYCAKDYCVRVTSPIQVELEGSHLPYAAPARFVVGRSNKITRVKNIDILDRCKEEIISAINKEKNNERQRTDKEIR